MSVYKMVKGFVKEAVKFAKEGAPHVTAKQYEQRLNACFSCPHLKEDVERCGLCGCLIEHKAKWATTTCPDKEEQRWDPVKVGSEGKRITLKKNGPKGNTTDTSDKAQSTDTKG
mgnify:FL=1|tara:strand:+ start:484 stop:825 length:342 start_codon:yes stop_codon:yes gene_type:complete